MDVLSVDPELMLVVLDHVLLALFVVLGLFSIAFALPHGKWKEQFIKLAARSRGIRVLHRLSRPLVPVLLLGVAIELYQICFTLTEDLHQAMKQRRAMLFVSSFILLLMLRRAFYLLRDNAEGVLGLEASVVQRNIEDIVNFVPPPLSVLAPEMETYKFIARPVFYGIESIPETSRGRLFVGNHSLLGLECPLLGYELRKERDIVVRPLGDHGHFYIPFWSTLLKSMGVVDGNRTICGALLNAGKSVLVYPGGAREVLKSKVDPKYGLKWGTRLGFAHMAIKCKSIIIPTISVGTEDMMDVVYDLPLGKLMGRKGVTAPVVKPLPEELQRVYFMFGDPIDTAEFDRDDSKENCQKVRDLTKQAIEEGIRFLKKEREEDPARMHKVVVEKGMTKLRENVSDFFGLRRRLPSQAERTQSSESADK